MPQADNMAKIERTESVATCPLLNAKRQLSKLQSVTCYMASHGIICHPQSWAVMKLRVIQLHDWITNYDCNL